MTQQITPAYFRDLADEKVHASLDPSSFSYRLFLQILETYEGMSPIQLYNAQLSITLGVHILTDFEGKLKSPWDSYPYECRKYLKSTKPH